MENQKMAYLAFHESWFDVLDVLDDGKNAAYQMVKRLADYAIHGIEPTDLGPTEMVVFKSCKSNIDNAVRRYNDRVEKNRRAGQMGGLAKGRNAGSRPHSGGKVGIAIADQDGDCHGNSPKVIAADLLSELRRQL